MNIVNKQIRVNNTTSPWFSYTGRVVEECKDGTFLVEFSGGRQRFISGMDFCFVGNSVGVYWSKVAA
jgi:hypothetical protein